MLEFRRETIKGIQREVVDNFPHHKVDILDYTTADLNVDWRAYIEIDEAGQACVVTARDDGELVGYVVYILDRHIHHGTIQATSHVTYIRPDYRRKGVAGQLLKRAEEELKEMDVFLVACFVLPAKDYSPMLVKSGYELAELVYTKKL